MKQKTKILFFMMILMIFISISVVSAHESDYPNVVIEKPVSNTEVSGIVLINSTVDDHHETQYVNYTIEGIDNKSYMLKYQDNNPSDGWTYTWDTSKTSNGRYYIQARAINNMGLKGEYNILVTVVNTAKNSILTIENTTIGVNQDTSVKLELTDENKAPLVNKEIVVTVNGKEQKIKTNNNGVGTIKYSNPAAGKYEIKGNFIGDSMYKSSNAIGYVNVIPTSIILKYGSYIGGNKNDKGKGVYVDKDGNIYLAMETSSDNLTTTPNAYQAAKKGTKDVFVSKFSPNGEHIFSTYIGGSKVEMQKDLKIDKDGNIYIVGFTMSDDLPVTDNALIKNLTGRQSGFLLVLNNDGTDLVYGTYLGGEKISRAWAVCVDDEYNAYIQGITNAKDFPVTPDAFQKNKDGIDWDGNVSGSDIDFQNSFDLFISKLNIRTGKLGYSTYFGGRGSDSTYGTLAIDKKGIVYFSGTTTSLDLPTTDNAYRKTHDVGLYDSFLTALDTKNNKLLFSSYIGGNDTENGEALYLDKNGNLYFIGDTWSSNFPTTENAFQREYKGSGENISGGDVFIMKINTSNWNIIYSTLLGGRFDDGVRALDVDDEGNVIIGGMTQSTDFPVTPDAFQKNKKGPEYINSNISTDYDFPTLDAFFAKISSDGSKLLYSTYFGGQYGEFVLGLTLNKGGLILQLRTFSDDLIVSDNAYQKEHGQDRFNRSLINRTNLYDMDSYLAIFSNPSFLTINPLNGNNGETITLTANLKESMGNRLLSGKNIKFFINGREVGSALTNDNGIATLDYRITEIGGNYLYSATYEGGLGHEAVNTTSSLSVPQSSVYLKITSNQSNLKVGDSVTITYTLGNNGPNPSENLRFTYTIPDGLEFLDASVNLGNYNYNPITKQLEWMINSLPQSETKLQLKMKINKESRYRLTPDLTTDTYDEPIKNIPNRYITITKKIQDPTDPIKNQSQKTKDSKISKISENLPEKIAYATKMNETANPILLLLLMILIVFVGTIKFKR